MELRYKIIYHFLKKKSRNTCVTFSTIFFKVISISMALELENGFTIIFTLITNYIKEFDLAKGLMDLMAKGYY